VLDVMLPELSGFEVLRRIRTTSRMPIIMLTARGEEVDRVVGLEMGADDYLAKPFSPRELVARIRAVLRRISGDGQQTNGTLAWGPLRLDLRARRADVNDHDLELTAAERRSGFVVALDGAVLRRGAFALGPVDLELAHGDRVLLAGPNGSGKSTIIAALAGDLAPAAGRRRVTPGAVIAQLGQAREALAADTRPLSAAVRAMAGLDERAARAALAAFGLDADAAGRPAATLSPGERTRAELAVLGHLRATCLLLDEPTNHLDVGSLEVLEHALSGWPGALVVATHDRRLREALALDREVAL